MTGFFRPRSSNKYIRRRGPGGYSGPAPPHICPETGQEVSYYHCASDCTKWCVHTEGDLARCKYEFEELKKSGFYARTEEEWLDHLHKADPENWQRLIEEKRNNERVLAEMEAERSSVVADTEHEEEQDTETSEGGQNKRESEDEDEKPPNQDEDDGDEHDDEQDEEEDDDDESDYW